MKKLLLVAILMLALVFTVVACNNEKPADTTAGETTVGQVPGTAEPAPETEAPEVPTEAPEVTTEAPEVPTEPETTVDDTPVTSAPPVVTTEPDTEAPVDPAAPVLKVEPDALASAATGNTASGIAGAEVMTEGGRTFVRLTASNGDPFFAAVSNAGAMPDYVAISYRTNSATDGEFFVGSGAGATGQGDNFQYVWNEGDWNLAIINLAETGVTTITDGVIGYLRLDCFAGNSAAGDYFDVEYIAFFNTPEYAQAYDFEMHKAPMWDIDKSVVTHQSFDELDTYAGGNKVAGVFAPGASAGWDKIVTLSDFSVDTLRYWGWIGAKGELGQFGYQINGGAAIYDDAWTHATEQPVIDAAATTGADCASRMQIMISLAGLDGENNVRVLYKTADGIEVCLNEFTVILPEKPKDIKDTFISDVASNEEGVDLKASDLANFFNIAYGAADPHKVTGGQYWYGGINEMFANVNGKYAFTVNMLEAADTAMMFVRGTHVVHSVDLPAVEGSLYPINNYYETDGLGRMGGAGIYAAIYGGKLNLMIKAYDDAGKVHIANKYYAIPVEGTELTMADDGEVVSILVNGKLMATVALSGSTSYEKICDLAEGVTFAQTAVVTLADGTTETIENTMVVSTCASQIGIALRPAAMKFDSVKVQAYSAIVIPEFEAPETEEPETEPVVPSNEIKVTTTDTYGWFDEYTFTADAAGTYTFTLPAGLGMWSFGSYDSWGEPELDFNLVPDGGDVYVALAAGAEFKFYVGATTKADWTITWSYTEGEVEPETEPSELTTIEPVLGENTVTITAADMEYGAVEGTLTVEAAGMYSITAADFVAIFYVDGMQQRGRVWLEPGTYDIALVIYAWAPGTYTYTLSVEYPPVPGDEDLPFEWTGSLDVTGDHDAWYEYTATEAGIWVITTPEGNYVSGLTNFNKVGNAYSVYVAKGDVVKFNLFGNTAGTYTSETVKVVGVSKDELRVMNADGIQIDQAFDPFNGGVASWNGILTIEENTFDHLVSWGWVALVGDSFQYFVEINGEMIASDDFYFEDAGITAHIANTWGEGVSGSRYYVTIPAAMLDRGGNMVKVGVIIDGAAHYFWEYTVVVEYDETATEAPEVTEPEVTAPAEPEVPEEPVVELIPFDGPFHANVDFINGKGPAGAANYAGLGSSKLNGDGSIPVRNAAEDGIVVNPNGTISIQGWMAVMGGINHYAFSVNGGELVTIVGGADGEPLPNHYANMGMPDSTKNGMINGIVADLSAYEGQTVTVTFYAIPEAAQDTVAPIVSIEGLVVPEILEAHPVAMDTWTVSGHASGLTHKDAAGIGPMVAAGGLEYGALLHQGSIGIGEIDLSQYSKVVVYYGMDNSDLTWGHYNANENNRIMLVTADTHMTNSPADGTIIAGAVYEPCGWALHAFEIDLTGVDYNGPVFVTYDTLSGTFMLIGAIEFYA